VSVTLATVELSDPNNAYPGLEGAFGDPIASFPVGKLYTYGALLGTYTRGPSANEITQEMMRRAEAIKGAPPGGTYIPVRMPPLRGGRGPPGRGPSGRGPNFPFDMEAPLMTSDDLG